MTPQKRWTMVAVVLGSAVVFLDSTVVNVALPKIGQDLPSRFFRVLEGQSLVYNAYLLSLSALLILAGALNDYYGRKKMYAIGLLGFGVTSVLCGAAPTLDLLILFRVLQGAAGAVLIPGSLSLIAAAFEGQERGHAFGVWAAGSAATTMGGPFVGGLLVDGISWRAIFLINVPLVAISYYATVKHVRESRDDQATGRFDWFGAAVIAVGVGGVSLGLIRGQEQGWDPFSLIILAIGLAAAAGFPFLMSRSSNPLIPLDLFRSRNFSVINIATLSIYGGMYVTYYLLNIFSQGTLGYNAAAAGIAVTPAIAFMVFFSSRFGDLAARRGPRLYISAGPVLMGLGVLWFARIPATSEPWVLTASNVQSLVPPAGYLADLLPGLLVFGFGTMMMVAPLTAALMASVPTLKAGVASAVNNAISRIGPQLAGAIVFVAVTAIFYANLADRVPQADTSAPAIRSEVAPLNRPEPGAPTDVARAAHQASTDAFHVAMLLSAGFLFLGGAINLVGIRDCPPAEVTGVATSNASVRVPC